MKPAFHRCLVVLGALVGAAWIAAADGVSTSQPVLKVPEGFSIELVAGPPLIERPIVAAFDDEGHLYVAESSGSNDPVEKQLEMRPHRIIRLDDLDDDGKFDKRTVFADRMMFPEGVLFFGGSVYVSAPPSIWKLTDADGDGVAENRVEWFQGKTLTGCANDLHGPYLGPDGWLYWCKGAFAEQTHIVNGREWTSRAAHVFRSRPDGSGLEPVITGGMDNPVDVAFTPEGERVLSATFLANVPRCDGLVHAVYGAVFGKDHGVLAGHPRTGELMPALVPMNPAAPCGLERYDSQAFGEEYRDNLFLCQFNLRTVSRHVLRPAGSSFTSEDSSFVTSEDVDFHPTDVLMDADGSLLVVDTGGWYKLCCPTSQLWKPDVVGGIYRVRRQDAPVPQDPRGMQIAWPTLNPASLWDLLFDARPAVRQRAANEFAHHQTTRAMSTFLADLAERGIVATLASKPLSDNANLCEPQTASLARTWAIARLETAESRSLIRQLLAHPDARVRQAALNAVSLYRDADAASRLVALLADDAPTNRRVAAEALGRIAHSAAVPHLLAAAASANDRALEHSITYALIELAQPDATKAGLLSKSPGTIRAALVALDQMPGGRIEPEPVVSLLDSSDEKLRGTARWLVMRHPEWGGVLVDWMRLQLATAPQQVHHDSPRQTDSTLESMLVELAGHSAIQQLLADTIVDTEQPTQVRRLALAVMARSKSGQGPPVWHEAIANVVDSADSELLAPAITAARRIQVANSPHAKLNDALLAVASDRRVLQELRVTALAIVSNSLFEMSAEQFDLLARSLSDDGPIGLRSDAANALSQARLSPDQLERLCGVIESAGPLELNRLVLPFQRVTDERLGLELLSSLKTAAALPSLRIDVVRETLAKYSPEVRQGVDHIESLLNIDAEAQRQRIDSLLPLVAQGDIHRGHAVFYSSKAACSACHRLGYVGGTSGPDLSRIGEIRTERDLLESLLYPSLSFVRGYEPVLILTTSGKTVNGTILDETEEEYVLATGPNESVHVPYDEVDEIRPGTVSIMPAGLDKQLSQQELADLIAFLKHAKEK